MARAGRGCHGMICPNCFEYSTISGSGICASLLNVFGERILGDRGISNCEQYTNVLGSDFPTPGVFVAARGLTCFCWFGLSD